MLTSTAVDVDIHPHFQFVNYSMASGLLSFWNNRVNIHIYIYTIYHNIIPIISHLFIRMSDNRLSYHSLKFEDEVLAKKQEPKCRIWNNEEVTHIIEQLCDPSGTYLRANRSLQHFRVLRALEVKNCVTWILTIMVSR